MAEPSNVASLEGTAALSRIGSTHRPNITPCKSYSVSLTFERAVLHFERPWKYAAPRVGLNPLGFVVG